jgi:hypothetical protein
MKEEQWASAAAPALSLRATKQQQCERPAAAAAPVRHAESVVVVFELEVQAATLTAMHRCGRIDRHFLRNRRGVLSGRLAEWPTVCNKGRAPGHDMSSFASRGSRPRTVSTPPDMRAKRRSRNGDRIRIAAASRAASGARLCTPSAISPAAFSWADSRDAAAAKCGPSAGVCPGLKLNRPMRLQNPSRAVRAMAPIVAALLIGGATIDAPGAGAAVTVWGSGGTGDAQFTLIGGVATDSSGNVYVSDLDPGGTTVSRIQKFSSIGSFIMRTEASSRSGAPMGAETESSSSQPAWPLDQEACT